MALSLALVVVSSSKAIAQEAVPEEAVPEETTSAEAAPTEAAPAVTPPADATATGGTAPSPAEPAAPDPSAEAPTPAEPDVRAPDVAPTDVTPTDVTTGGKAERKVFQYTEDLKIIGPPLGGEATQLHLRSNVLVVVTTERDTITVEVRPDPNREPLETPGSPPPGAPGRITLVGEGGGASDFKGQWDIQPQTAAFTFIPDAKSLVSVKGLPKDLGVEAIGILGQGPRASTPKQGSETEYQILVRSNHKDWKLQGKQKTRDLWVDWVLTGAGTFEVGAEGWQMPMEFHLEGDADRKGRARLTAQASMRYSSARPGPEEETKLVTTLALTGKRDGYSYVRESVLRPISHPMKNPGDEKSGKLAAKKALAGGASAWARTATLATLGVQRLAGVRETGLAMWLAQAAIDTAAGRVVPKAAERPQRRAIKTLAKYSPLLEPPKGVIHEETFSENWLVRFEAGQNFMRIRSRVDDGGPGPQLGNVVDIVVPDLTLALRRKFGENWRLGGGVDALMVRVDTGSPRVSWALFGLTGRAEYITDRWNVGLSAGTAFVRYEMDSPTRSATGDLRTMFLGLDVERMLRRKWGLGLRARYGGDASTLSSAFLQMGLRYYFTRYACLQLHLSAVTMTDSDAVGGPVNSWEDGPGYGVGVLMRW